MMVSAPSSENRFWPTYLVCRKVSNASAALSLLRMYFCCGDGRLLMLDLDALLQPASAARVRGCGCTPRRRGGSRRRAAPRARRAASCARRPAKPLTLNSRSRSHSVRPWVSTSRSGWLRKRRLVQSQRVDVGHQVAAVAVGRDQLDDPGVLVVDRIRVVGAPAHRLIGDAELAEDLVEEVVGRAAAGGRCAGSRRTPRPG